MPVLPIESVTIEPFTGTGSNVDDPLLEDVTGAGAGVATGVGAVGNFTVCPTRMRFGFDAYCGLREIRFATVVLFLTAIALKVSPETTLYPPEEDDEDDGVAATGATVGLTGVGATAVEVTGVADFAGVVGVDELPPLGSATDCPGLMRFGFVLNCGLSSRS